MNIVIYCEYIFFWNVLVNLEVFNLRYLIISLIFI